VEWVCRSICGPVSDGSRWRWSTSRSRHTRLLGSEPGSGKVCLCGGSSPSERPSESPSNKPRTNTQSAFPGVNSLLLSNLVESSVCSYHRNDTTRFHAQVGCCRIQKKQLDCTASEQTAAILSRAPTWPQHSFAGTVSSETSMPPRCVETASCCQFCHSVLQRADWNLILHCVATKRIAGGLTFVVIFTCVLYSGGGGRPRGICCRRRASSSRARCTEAA
jgi:hypothetical protein